MDVETTDSANLHSRRFAELTTTELHEILRLRSDVFVVEQECVYPDIDGRDIEADTVHHWITSDGSIAAYARELHGADAVAIGRVVTHPEHRKRGFASVLVSHIRDTTPGPIRLEAQSYLVGWYEAHGFEVAGEQYIEDGIPHVSMTRG